MLNCFFICQTVLYTVMDFSDFHHNLNKFCLLIITLENTNPNSPIHSPNNNVLLLEMIKYNINPWNNYYVLI